MSIKLTARQQQILDLIRQAVVNTGFPPTRAEIAQTLGFKSANAAEDHLRALARKGVIELTAGASRGIRLTDLAQEFSAEFDHSDIRQDQDDYSSNMDGIDSASDAPRQNHSRSSGAPQLRDLPGAGNILLPLVGRVAAGFPILATENVEKELSVDPNLFTQRPDYLLKVKGLSMRDAGILDGDLLAIKKTSEARNGQIVVARIDDEVTVKRLSKHGSVIHLLPENPDFAPIIIEPGQNFALEGIALGLIRNTPLQ
ncbi:MAG: transcriptional repressor LexA [Sheuella sp.]|nr:transcriptional repressor LexA [Sheuella sp.]